MTIDPDATTRDRIVAAAMDLFGRQGYQATTVAQVEASAGLSAGAGGLYRHFPSKRAVLEEGLRRQAEAGEELVTFIEDPALLDELSPRERLRTVARAGLRRLDEERDVNRLLLRDLAAFPDLLEQVRQQELRRVFDALVGWLVTQSGDSQPRDWPAVAAVLMAAVSHYWVLTDIFSGSNPLGIDEDRFLTALIDIVADVLPASPSDQGRSVMSRTRPRP